VNDNRKPPSAKPLDEAQLRAVYGVLAEKGVISAAIRMAMLNRAAAAAAEPRTGGEANPSAPQDSQLGHSRTGEPSER